MVFDKLLLFEKGLSEHLSAVLATALAEVLSKDNPLVKAGLISEDRTYFSSILFAVILFLVIVYSLGYLSAGDRHNDQQKIDELCKTIDELKQIIVDKYEKEVI